MFHTGEGGVHRQIECDDLCRGQEGAGMGEIGIIWKSLGSGPLSV